MSDSSLTQLLADWRDGNAAARDALLPVVYQELRQLASSYLRRERPNHTLQSTALVNEAYLKLIDQKVNWNSRAHFFGVAAQVMRRILCDYARARSRDKRGAGVTPVSLDASHWLEFQAIADHAKEDLVALDTALEKLAALDPVQCQVVEMRFFSGMTVEETAEVLGLSTATVKRYWATARAFLARELAPTAS
ncbi:MAG: sigma-70 family RNA polymerase sigma factor [Bryobacter sp.]|nr:sigma-70 family RNA polymerase sigma factor [Bryobacter sp.]